MLFRPKGEKLPFSFLSSLLSLLWKSRVGDLEPKSEEWKEKSEEYNFYYLFSCFLLFPSPFGSVVTIFWGFRFKKVRKTAKNEKNPRKSRFFCLAFFCQDALARVDKKDAVYLKYYILFFSLKNEMHSTISKSTKKTLQIIVSTVP